MKWHKLGLIYANDRRSGPLSTHASTPVALHIEGSLYRIFFSARDDNNRSSVGSIDINIKNRKVVQERIEPIQGFGPQGSFYESGISLGNIFAFNGALKLCFMGWQTPIDDHWRGQIGFADLLGADEMCNISGPVLAFSHVDAHSFSYPFVINSGNGLRMWYGSTLVWDSGNGEMLHAINQASSADGVRWDREGMAIPIKFGEAQAFSRPWVKERKNGGFDMWYSVRGAGRLGAYRIGHSFSEDGKTWTGAGSAGIEISAGGWDSQMIEYPCVFDHCGETYMLYNGNAFGRSGIGLALLERGPD